jgi:hypothetical protein
MNTFAKNLIPLVNIICDHSEATDIRAKKEKILKIKR